MAIKSKARRRKFAELLLEGKISPETFEEWNREAGDAELPDGSGRSRHPRSESAPPWSRTFGSVLAVMLVSALGCADDDEPTAVMNQPPVVQPIPDMVVQIGDTLQIQASAEDPEGDDVVYRLVIPIIFGAGTAEAAIDSSSGEFRFVPQPSDGTLRWFGVFARDSKGAEGSEEFYVLID